MPTQHHVLIVEDNTDLLAIYQARLIADGYSVATANEGKAAFNRIQEQKPDCILLDIIMPGMDGLEFLRLAKKEVHLHDVPIVVMTNLGQDEDRVQCEKLGARKFIVKTELNIDDLAHIVQQEIDGKKA